MLTALLTLFCYCSMMGWQPAVAGEKITLVTEDLWPLNYLEAGELKGTAPPVVFKLLAKAGLDYELRVLPWARAYKIAKEQPNVVIFSMHRTPARETKFRWIGLVAKPDKVSLFRRTSRPLTITTLNDARTYSVAAKIGDRNYEYLVEQGFDKVHPVSTTSQCIQMLMRGRIDLIIGHEQIIRHYMAQLSLSADDIKPVLSLPTDALFVAASLQTSPALYQRLLTAYRALEASGELAHLQETPITH